LKTGTSFLVSVSWKIISLLLLLWLSGIISCVSVDKNDKEIAVPLGNHSTCNDCHDGLEPSLDGEFCLICHYDYNTNHHPINFEPPQSDLIIHDFLDMPLFDGKIQCLTCHQVHGGEGLNQTPRMLRGGPYSQIRLFCYRCHYQEKYQNINVHKMHETDGSIRIVQGKIICLFCHSEEPYAYLDRTYDVKFRADATFLCWRCHPPMAGDFFRQHFLEKPSDEMRLDIYRFELENDVILPLVPRGKVTCSTCHNPHQAEVMITEASRAGADTKGRLRIRPPRLCMGCHPV
jgi:predicted CXXCH cytochrome family protein